MTFGLFSYCVFFNRPYSDILLSSINCNIFNSHWWPRESKYVSWILCLFSEQRREVSGSTDHTTTVTSEMWSLARRPRNQLMHSVYSRDVQHPKVLRSQACAECTHNILVLQFFYWTCFLFVVTVPRYLNLKLYLINLPHVVIIVSFLYIWFRVTLMFHNTV
jgi:hypothetical protein